MSSKMEDIIAKIRDIDGLPTYEEARKLISFFEVRKQTFPNEKSWSRFCLENIGVWSVYNIEFVDGLADVISRLSEPPILELCAGDGKLSYHLRKRGIDIKATDDYSDESIPRKENFVERRDYREALEEYKPRIVVVGWWPAVKRYALNFPTVSHFLEFPCADKDYQRFNRDGVEISLLVNLSKHYICCGDDDPQHFGHEVRLLNKKQTRTS